MKTLNTAMYYWLAFMALILLAAPFVMGAAKFYDWLEVAYGVSVRIGHVFLTGLAMSAACCYILMKIIARLMK